MAQFGGATGHRIEDFQSRYQFTSGEYLHGQPTVGETVHRLGKTLRSGAQARKVLWPGGDHFPAKTLLGLSRFFGGGGGLIGAGAEGHSAQAEADGSKEFAAFHRDSLVIVV